MKRSELGASPRPRPQRWHFDRKVLAISLLAAVVAGPSAYAWHEYQVQRNSAVLLARAKSLEAEGNWSSAAQQLRSYVRLKPDDADARIRWAQLTDRAAEEDSQKNLAIELYVQALDLVPGRIELRARLASLLAEEGRFAEAEQQARSVLGRETTNAAAMRVLALSLHGRSRTAGAGAQAAVAEAYLRALEQNPHDLDLAARLAEFYHDELLDPDQAARRELADKLIQKMVEANPDNGLAYLLRYRYRLKYDADAAVADLDEALRRAPDNFEVLCSWGEYSQRNGDESAAADFFRRAIRANPNARSGYLKLSESLTSQGHPAEAATVLREGLDRFSQDDVVLSLRLAAALMSTRQLTDGGKLLDTIEHRFTSMIATLPAQEQAVLRDELNLLRGSWFAAHEQFSTAIARLKVVVASQPVGSAGQQSISQHVLAWKALGACYAARRQWDLAAGAFEQAAVLQGNSAELYQLAAEAWSAAGRLTAAVAWHERATEADGASPGAWLQLAKARLQLERNLPQAKRDWTGFDVALTAAKQLHAPPMELAILDAFYALQTGRTYHGWRSLEEADIRFSSQAEYWRLAMVLREQCGNPSRADMAWDRLRMLENPLTPTSICSRAEILVARNQLSNAQDLLEQVGNGGPAELETVIKQAKAEIQLRRGNLSEARAGLLALTLRTPEQVEYALRTAELSLQQKDFKTLQTLEQQVRQAEGADGCLWRLFQAWRLLGQANDAQSLDAAEKLRSEIEARRPYWAAGEVLKARLFERQGLASEAVLAYQRAIELGERHLESYRRLLSLLTNQLRLSDAAAVLEQLAHNLRISSLRLTSAEETWTYALRLALTGARQEVQNKPADISAKIWLAWLLAMAHRTSESRELLEAAIATDAGDARPWVGEIAAACVFEQPRGAERVLSRLDAQSDLPEAEGKFVRAQGYELLGQSQAARQLYLEAKQLSGPDDPLAKLIANGTSKSLALHDLSQGSRLSRLLPVTAAERRAVVTLLADREGEQGWKRAFALLEESIAGGKATDADRRMEAFLLVKRGWDGDVARAIEILEKIAGSGTHKVDSDQFWLARLYERTGASAKAERALLALADRKPAERVHTAALVDFLLRNRRHTAAEPWLAQWEQVEPGSTTVLERKARLLQLQQRKAEIAPLLMSFLEGQLSGAKSDSERHRLLRESAQIAAAERQFDVADELYRRLFASSDDVGPLANYLAERGRMSEAIDGCLAWSAQHQGPQGALLLCSLLASHPATPDLHERAEPAIAAAIEHYAHDENVLLAAGTLRYLQQREAESTSLLRELMRIAPDHTMGLNNLALTLSELPGRQTEALEQIRRAIEIDGRQPQLLDTLGVALLSDHQAGEAIKVLEEAVFCRGGDPRWYLHLAVAYAQSGSAIKAAEFLRQSETLGIGRQTLTAAEHRQWLELKSRFDSFGSAARDSRIAAPLQ